MLSDSSIRRLMRQRNFPRRCRNQNAGLDGPMGRARLALRGRHRFPIGFSFFKHPKARLRKVASHGHFGFAMAAARFNPLVKSADMIVATALAIENRAVGSFHKSPLQIHIDISTNRSVVKFPPAGVLTRHQPAVASELLSTGERSIVPISVQITTARISPTPGRLLSKFVSAHGAKASIICASITLRFSLT